MNDSFLLVRLFNGSAREFIRSSSSVCGSWWIFKKENWKTFNIIWLSRLWILWKERNKSIFQQKEEHIQSLEEKKLIFMFSSGLNQHILCLILTIIVRGLILFLSNGCYWFFLLFCLFVLVLDNVVSL